MTKLFISLRFIPLFLVFGIKKYTLSVENLAALNGEETPTMDLGHPDPLVPLSVPFLLPFLLFLLLLVIIISAQSLKDLSLSYSQGTGQGQGVGRREINPLFLTLIPSP